VIAHAQVLKTDAEKKAMAGCVEEISPDAKLLAELGNPKAKLDQGEVVTVLKRLVVSENAFTQILVGRLMGSSVAERVKPDADVLFLALLSHRAEVKKGALVWAKKYAVLPRKVRVVVEEIAMEEKDEGVAKQAREVLRGGEGGGDEEKGKRPVEGGR
jgi:hypothetical protein